MKIPERCEGCPRIAFYLEQVEAAEESRDTNIERVQRFMKLRQTLMDSASFDYVKLLEDLEDEESREEALAIILENTDSIFKGVANLIDIPFRISDERVEISEDCISTLVESCEGLESFSADCGSGNVQSADEKYDLWVSSLKERYL